VLFPEAFNYLSFVRWCQAIILMYLIYFKAKTFPQIIRHYSWSSILKRNPQPCFGFGCSCHRGAALPLPPSLLTRAGQALLFPLPKT